MSEYMKCQCISLQIQNRVINFSTKLKHGGGVDSKEKITTIN